MDNELVYLEKNSYVASGLTGEIIGVAMEVHSQLGPGFLESVYEEALAVEFELKGVTFQRQKNCQFSIRAEILSSLHVISPSKVKLLWN